MESLFPVQYAYLIPLLPLIGAAIAGFFGAKWLKQKSHLPIWIGVFLSAALSFWLLFGMLKHAPHGHAQEVTRTEHGQLTTAPRSAEEIHKDDFAVSARRFLFRWIEAGQFKADAAFWFDPLTALMLCVVTGIGFLITVFAAGYMKGEAGYFRFFAYLGLFIFMMTILVMADNFLLMYLGWEGVGLCSYLLIGYYYDKPAAREAAKKAFLVNRVGDFGFGLGIMLLYTAFGTISFFGDVNVVGDGVLEIVSSMAPDRMTDLQKLAMVWAPFLLMLGAFGKSAQFPLYVWLPDAMEGPTPVSALIHAATMVTAGVYMIVRCGALFVANGSAMFTIACVGTFTAIFAATIAMRQFDLKKVFAYSTISQLGFMFAAVGVVAPVAAMFHLMTHAFFKALLFLASGVVMHAMLGHLDMRKMSGLKGPLPWTHRFMLVGCLALAGFPFFSGFFSKDEIVIWAWHSNKFLGVVLLLTAFLTAYYTFRLYFRVFQGPLIVPDAPAEGHHGHEDHDHDHAEEHAHASASAVHARDTKESGVDKHLAHEKHHQETHHNHEPMVMMLPLAILALGAILAGYLNWPERDATLGHFLHNSPSLLQSERMARAAYGTVVSPAQFGGEEVEDEHVRHEMHSLHLNMMIVSGLISVMGIYLAYLLHLKYRERGEALPRAYPVVNRVLEAKYWVDEVYQAGIVEPLRALGRVLFAVDRYVIDGVVWAVGFVPQLFGFSLKLTAQRGSLQGYAALMLLGLAVILLVLFL
jgi:NADH-quinone oxidoreductase subunit L